VGRSCEAHQRLPLVDLAFSDSATRNVFLPGYLQVLIHRTFKVQPASCYSNVSPSFRVSRTWLACNFCTETSFRTGTCYTPRSANPLFALLVFVLTLVKSTLSEHERLQSWRAWHGRSCQCSSIFSSYPFFFLRGMDNSSTPSPTSIPLYVAHLSCSTLAMGKIGKGTGSFGKRHNKSHTLCRR